MDEVEIFIALLVIIVGISVLFRESPIPTALILVIAGMLASFIPFLPPIKLEPNLVLDIFLPLLIYAASAYSSWRDIKLDFRSIALLSVGHVLFITVLVASAVHLLLPQLGWPMAFVLGAVISPPDDVAIVSIAEKIRMPQRIVTILKAEGLLNDAPALILFRFSLAALLTHEFSPLKAISSFFLIVICETIYGFALGHVIGKLRLKLHDPILQTMISLLTPFLAYLPAEKLGGSGILATVVTGMYIGNNFYALFPAEVRLVGHSVWSTLGFVVQNILFLLVGFDLRYILHSISSIPSSLLLLYSSVIIVVVIAGRFIWVYPAAYLPRLLFGSIRKKDPYPPWQYPFIISWAGMRGGISLAAALAVPMLPMTVDGANPRDLLVFLVFCVITATLLLQGLALPWVLKLVGISHYEQREKMREQLVYLQAKLAISQTVLQWLHEYQNHPTSNPLLKEEVNLRLNEYTTLNNQLQTQIKDMSKPDTISEHFLFRDTASLSLQLLTIERKELSRLWQEGKITHAIRNKLGNQLDIRSKHLTEIF